MGRVGIKTNNAVGDCGVINNTYSERVETICMELENDYKVWKEVEDFWRKNVNNKDKEELIDTLAIKVKNIYSIGKDISYNECKQIAVNWIEYMNEEYDR